MAFAACPPRQVHRPECSGFRISFQESHWGLQPCKGEIDMTMYSFICTRSKMKGDTHSSLKFVGVFVGAIILCRSSFRFWFWFWFCSDYDILASSSCRRI